MLQGGTAGVEGVREVIVEETADGGHVDVGEAAKAPGEVGGVVAGSEDAPKLWVEQVFGHRPVTQRHMISSCDRLSEQCK